MRKEDDSDSLQFSFGLLDGVRISVVSGEAMFFELSTLHAFVAQESRVVV